jgi:excisionase family DNA binding protein
MNEPRRWLTIKEAAEYLGISVKGAYDMAAAGKLPAARVGRLVRVDLRSLEADLERQVQGTPAAVRGRGRAK